MTLQVGAAGTRLERLRVGVLVVGIFEDRRPLRGSAGLADWRLCGALSQLIRADRFRGGSGEAALIPGQGGLCARWVLALGLGRSGAFDPAARRDAARQALTRALELRVSSLALALDPEADPEFDLESSLEAVLAGASDAWSRTREPPERFALALLVPAERRAQLVRALQARSGSVAPGLRVVLPRDREGDGRARADPPVSHASS